MKFSCYKNDLIDALKLVSKAVAVKPSTPVLSGIYLKGKDNRIELQANNLSLGVIAGVPANVEVEGEVVVSGKRLVEFVKSMPDDTVTFDNEVNQNSLAITSGGANVDLLTMTAEDFPKVKMPDTDRSFKISSSILGNLIHKTVFAVAVDESRPVFTGVLFELKPNKISLVATNTHRLALASEYLEHNQDDVSFIVPAETLRGILPLLNTNTDSNFVSVNYSFKQLSFAFDNFFVTSRLIEGVFPPYDKIVNCETPIRVEVDTAEFKDAVNFVSLMAKETEYNTIKFIVTDGEVEVSANSQDAGAAIKSIKAKTEGGNVNISFNVAYIADRLRVAEGKVLKIEFNDAVNPIRITEPDNDNFIYIATPVRA